MNHKDTALDRRSAAGRRPGAGGDSWERLVELTRVELGLTWPSYLVTAVSFVFFGLLGLTLLWSNLAGATGGVEDELAPFWIDYVFLLLLANLGINWASLRWLFLHRDPFTFWLTFLRTLPISVRELVLARVMVLLASTVVMSVLYFLPLYVLFGPLRAEVPPVRYLWFVLFWIGYALLSGGGLLYMELGVRGKIALLISFIWIIPLVTLAILAVWLDVPIVFGVLRLIEAHGPLPSIVSLAVGGGALYACCRLLMRRLRTRELLS